MAAPRATQFLALRNLTRNITTQQIRHLHMTGPATYASHVLSKQSDQPFTLPNDTDGLRTECMRRKISAAGSKIDLIERLKADEAFHQTRHFSNSTPAEIEPHRPTARKDEPEAVPVRHFNTSRAMKKPGDTSTIDFAYLPSADFEGDEQEYFRVPILPSTTTPSNIMEIEPEDVVVMKPEISTMSADAVFLPMSEFTDGHAMNIDFHAMADRVAANIKRMQVPVEEQASMMKRIWGDLVDDMLAAAQGGKKSSS